MNFKKTLKTTAILLIICSILSGSVLAAFPDMSTVTSLFARNSVTKLLVPITETLDSAVALSIRAAQNREAQAAERTDRGNAAYVVSATQRLNMETEKYYAELTLINETGLFTVLTVDDVENFDFQSVLVDGHIGKISSLTNKFVKFDMKNTDKIQRLEPRRSVVSNEFTTDDGFYLVNIVDERNGLLLFYDTDTDVNVNGSPIGCPFRKNGYAIISIDDNEYYGENLSKISRGIQSLPAGFGNAVIQISKGEVLRVFSFEGGYEN